MSADLEPATFLERHNRFTLSARLNSGEVVRAYLPNTSRLIGVLVPQAALLVEPVDDPKRSTRWTVKRVVQGDTLISIETAFAEQLVERWLESTHHVPGLGGVRGWRREVRLERHRFDFQLQLEASPEPAWLEVKSLSGADDGVAHFSRTPSSRATRHLAVLGEVASAGVPCAVVFVVQRGDVTALAADEHADPAWLAAIRGAHAAGVHITALAADITPTGGTVRGTIPIRGLADQ